MEAHKIIKNAFKELDSKNGGLIAKHTFFQIMHELNPEVIHDESIFNMFVDTCRVGDGDFVKYNDLIDYIFTGPVHGSDRPQKCLETVGSASITRQIQAATFRQLVAHFQANPQGCPAPEMMNLSGFCRNCVAKWYMKAAHDVGEAVDTDA